MATVTINIDSQVPNVTRLDVQTAITGSALSTQKAYVITDAVGGTKRLVVFATANNAISSAVINQTDGNFGTYDITTDVYTASAGGSFVETVSGDPVDNTDPLNPVVNAIPLAGTSTAVSGNVQVDDAVEYYYTDGTYITSMRAVYGRGWIIGMTEISSGDSTVIDMRYDQVIISSYNTSFIGAAYAGDYSANFQSGSLIDLRTLKKRFWTKAGIPTTSDDNTQGYTVGSLLWDTTNSKMYRATSVTTGAAAWTEVFSGGVTDGDKGDVVVSSSGTVWTVEALQTRPVSNTAPTTGQLLVWNGSAWTPTTHYNSATASPAGTLAAGLTRYVPVNGSNAIATGEGSLQHVVPFALTTVNATCYLVITTAIVGSATITLRKNGVDTGLVITIPNGSTTGIFSATGAISFASTDLWSWKLVGATTNSIQVNNITLNYI